MIFERLVSSSSFERILKTHRCAATPHFALHHHASQRSTDQELSTSGDPNEAQLVEDSPCGASVDRSRKNLGVVVPKRHARRAVTRSLLKRQIYAAGERHGLGLPAGQWVVRLRRPFDGTLYPSAASMALRDAARAELEALFGGASRFNRK